MSEHGFFKSKPVKYAISAGCLTLLIGTVASVLFAKKVEAICESASQTFRHEMFKNISFTNLDATLKVADIKIPVTFEDLTTMLPSNWLEVIQESKELNYYCLMIPLMLGLSFTLASVFSLTTLIGFFAQQYELHKAPETLPNPDHYHSIA